MITHPLQAVKKLKLKMCEKRNKKQYLKAIWQNKS
jgi:hypothetical protein